MKFLLRASVKPPFTVLENQRATQLRWFYLYSSAASVYQYIIHQRRLTIVVVVVVSAAPAPAAAAAAPPFTPPQSRLTRCPLGTNCPLLYNAVYPPPPQARCGLGHSHTGRETRGNQCSTPSRLFLIFLVTHKSLYINTTPSRLFLIFLIFSHTRNSLQCHYTQFLITTFST